MKNQPETLATAPRLCLAHRVEACEDESEAEADQEDVIVPDPCLLLLLLGGDWCLRFLLHGATSVWLLLLSLCL